MPHDTSPHTNYYRVSAAWHKTTLCKQRQSKDTCWLAIRVGTSSYGQVSMSRCGQGSSLEVTDQQLAVSRQFSQILAVTPAYRYAPETSRHEDRRRSGMPKAWRPEENRKASLELGGVPEYIFQRSPEWSDECISECTDVMFTTTACLGLARSVVNLDLYICMNSLWFC